MPVAASVVIHVFIILLFVWSGKNSSDPTPQPTSVATETKEAAPTPPSPETPHATAEPIAEPVELPSTQDYKVKQGDNLTRLARNAGTTTAELARLNGVDEKELAKLKIGQTIKLPIAQPVRRGPSTSAAP